MRTKGPVRPPDRAIVLPSISQRAQRDAIPPARARLHHLARSVEEKVSSLGELAKRMLSSDEEEEGPPDGAEVSRRDRDRARESGATEAPRAGHEGSLHSSTWSGRGGGGDLRTREERKAELDKATELVAQAAALKRDLAQSQAESGAIQRNFLLVSRVAKEQAAEMERLKDQLAAEKREREKLEKDLVVSRGGSTPEMIRATFDAYAALKGEHELLVRAHAETKTRYANLEQTVAEQEKEILNNRTRLRAFKVEQEAENNQNSLRMAAMEQRFTAALADAEKARAEAARLALEAKAAREEVVTLQRKGASDADQLEYFVSREKDLLNDREKMVQAVQAANVRAAATLSRVKSEFEARVFEERAKILAKAQRDSDELAKFAETRDALTARVAELEAELALADERRRRDMDMAHRSATEAAEREKMNMRMQVEEMRGRLEASFQTERDHASAAEQERARELGRSEDELAARSLAIQTKVRKAAAALLSSTQAILVADSGISDLLRCVHCRKTFENPVVNVPCGHSTFCDVCAIEFATSNTDLWCPSCNIEIKSKCDNQGLGAIAEMFTSEARAENLKSLQLAIQAVLGSVDDDVLFVNQHKQPAKRQHQKSADRLLIEDDPDMV